MAAGTESEQGMGTGTADVAAGKAPALAGKVPAPAGKAPALAGKAPALAGKAPALAGKAPALAGKAPALAGKAPALAGKAPVQAGKVPALAGKAPDQALAPVPALDQAEGRLVLKVRPDRAVRVPLWQSVVRRSRSRCLPVSLAARLHSIAARKSCRKYHTCKHSVSFM
jgi:hypothetical protein